MNEKKMKETIANKRDGSTKPSLGRGAWGFDLDFVVMRKSGKAIPIKENVDFSAVQRLAEEEGVYVAISGIVFKRNINFRVGDSLICRRKAPFPYMGM